MSHRFLLTLFSFLALNAHAEIISGSPFSTQDAPLPEHIQSKGEKTIVVDPRTHFFGAYNAAGKLIRWGLATAGKNKCADSTESCRTKTGHFRIYSLGDESCTSKKYPLPDGGAPMPYCLYFAGGQALHGSDDISLDNQSHGCVRVHVDDAKWLRYQFVEGPSAKNHYQGTKVIIKPY